MSVLRFIKKGFWCLVAALASVLAWFTNGFQLIRNTLLFVLDLPGKALTAATIFIGVVYGVACFFMGGGVLNTLGNIAGGCLVIFLAYKIFNFIYMIGYALLGSVLSFFDFDGVTNFFAGLLQTAIYRYMNQFGPNDPTKKDRCFLFGVPWVIHKINWLAEKLSSVIGVALYVVSGGAGIYFGYQWIFASDDVSSYGTIDYIIGIAAVVAISIIAIWLGHCLSQSTKMAMETVKPLDELFGVYAEFFRNAEAGTDGNGNYENRSNNSWDRTQDEQADYHAQAQRYDDNPYYEILCSAQSADELQKIYRREAKRVHPDVCKEFSPQEATRRMALLNNAYEAMRHQF